MSQTLQSKLFATNHKTFDAIIIGGGPAGVNCALELSYCHVESLLIDASEQVGGQLWEIPNEILNLASGYFKDGPSLAKSMQKLTEKAKINLLLGRSVTQIDAQSKTVSVESDLYRANSILLATGSRLKRLDLPGVSLFHEDILYRDQSPVSRYAGARLAVLGGGDNALLKALDLAQLAEQVYLLNRSKYWRARSEFLQLAEANTRIEIIDNTELESLSGSSKLNGTKLNGAKLIDKSTGRIRNLTIDKMFVKIGYTPNTEAFRGQVKMDESGYIKTDNLGRSSALGVWAAGDIVSSLSPRIAIAMGGGSAAAEAIQVYLGKRNV